MQEDKSYSIYPILFFISQVIILVTGYSFGRMGFGMLDIDVYKSIGLIFTIILIPYELSCVLQKRQDISWSNSIPFLTLLTLLFIVPLGLFAYSLSINLSYIISTLGILLLMRFFFQIRQSLNLLYNVKILILPAIALGTWSIGDIWGKGIHSPLFIEGLAVGIGHVDTLFHITIAQMFKTYGTPSLGLDGVSFLHYHFGSHILAASFSSLLNIPLIKIYNLAFPLFLASFFSYSIIHLAINFNKALFNRNEFTFIFWWALILGIIGIFPEKIRNMFALWNVQFTSESYSLTLSLSCLLICVILQFWKEQLLKPSLSTKSRLLVLLILPTFLYIIGLSKISVACLLVSAIGYLFLRLNLFKKPIYILAFMLLCLAFSLAIINYSSPTNKSSLVIDPFNFIFKYIDSTWRFLFIPIYYLSVIVYIIFRFKKLGAKNIKSAILQYKTFSLIDIEVLLILSFVGFLPICLLYISQGNVAYFSDYQRWISLAMVLSFTLYIKLNFKKLSTIKKGFILLMSVCFIFVLSINILNSAIRFVYENYKIRNAITATVLSKNRSPVNIKTLYKTLEEPHQILLSNSQYKMILHLMELDLLPPDQKRSSLLFISQHDSIYWKTLSSNRISLLAPSLTGIASIDGTPPILEHEKTAFYDDYFFSDYQFRRVYQTEEDRNIPILLEKVKRKNKSMLIVWNEDSLVSFYK